MIESKHTPKMKLTTITLTVVLLAGCAQPWQATGVQLGRYEVLEKEASYPWTTRSKWLCGAMVGAHYLDYETTRRLNFGESINADGSGGSFRETNLLIPGHPSDSDVALLKGGVVIGTVLLAELFPEHRDIIFFCSGAIAGVAAGGNLRLYEHYK